MRRASHGPVHEAVCAAQADVLAARLAMGDLDEAARLAREVLALRRTLHGDDGVYVALSMTDLASVLYERNDPASLTECVDLYRQAAAIAQRRLGGEHRLTLVTRRSLANALVRAGQGEEAEQILREVTAKLPSVIGETHEDYLHTLNSYGYLLFQLERPDEAVVQYHKALEISEKVFGPEHDNTLRPLSNLAAIEKDRGLASASDADGDGKIDVVAGTDLSRAIEHYQRVLAGFEKLYGPKHHHTASTAYALGDLYDKIGRDREAADLLGRNAEALALNKPPEWDQTITRVLLRQGLALMRLGAASEAEPVLRRSVEQCRAVFPAGDWRTALCASALGACLKETGQLTEAETLLTESLAALEPQRAKRKKDYAAAKERLVSVYEAQGRPEQAAALRARE
jgi:tetratricopeptide (TPR) repeat protein